MASIRKRGGRYHAQIRKSGYPSITQTFSSLTIANRWATATEADIERNLYVAPADGTLGELLDRYEREVSPLHKSHEIEGYRLKTLKKHLGNQRVATLASTVIAKYRDERLKTVSPASLKRELVILSSVLNTAIKE